MTSGREQAKLGIHRGAIALQVILQFLDLDLLGFAFALVLEGFHFFDHPTPDGVDPSSGGPQPSDQQQ